MNGRADLPVELTSALALVGHNAPAACDERGREMVGRRLVAVLAVAVAAPFALAACGDEEKPTPASWVGSAPPSSAPSAPAGDGGAPASDVQLAVTPSSGKKDVAISAEI